MKALGYIWKIAGGICFIGLALLLSFGVCFCQGPHPCTYYFIATWGGSILAGIGHILLLPRPINMTTLYRIDVALLYTVFLAMHNKKGMPYFLFHGACALTILAVIISTIKNRVKHQKEIKKAMPPKPRPNEISALFQTILNHKTEEVKAALAADPTQLNIPYASNGNTPLHVAVWNEHKDIVELLLAQPAIDTQLKNKDGKTALDLAQEKNLTEIVNLLQNR
ncbi:ankyrin repeat domain-containing protein [Candidatus Avelusimicrobium sp.]